MTTTEDELRGYFEPYGEIKSVKILRDRDGRSKRSGFVTYFYTKCSETACRELNGKYRDKSEALPLHVRPSDRRNKDSAPRGGAAPHGGNQMYQQNAGHQGNFNAAPCTSPPRFIRSSKQRHLY